MKRTVLVYLVTLSVLGSYSLALAQGTAFTYQGRLTDGGNAAGGLYDFRFMLFKDGSDGSQTGPTLTNAAVEVSSGLFTVSLDFGGSFPGDERWLEIAVRTNGSAGDFTSLSPRQRVTATPYALTAGAISGKLPASQLSGTLPGGNLGGTYSAAVTFSNPGNNIAGNGAGLSNLDASQLAAGTVPEARLSANVSLLGPSVESAEITDATIGTADIASIDAGKILGGDLQAARLEVGTNHTLSASWATIAGGSNNAATYPFATVGGGQDNSAWGDYATVAGGVSNCSWGASTTIGGGIGNTNAGYSYGTIAGGFKNSIRQTFGFIGGGCYNSATGTLAVVVGGDANIAGGSTSVVGGGRYNEATGYRSVIGGGYGNKATNNYTTIGGGYMNTAGGYAATIPGGYLNAAQSNYCFAAGYRAKAYHSGTFVWGDMSNNDVSSTNDNSMTFRASGGVRFFSNGSQSSGVYLAPGGTSWAAISDRNAKKNFAPVDSQAVLEQLVAVPVQRWNYRWESDDTPRHLGPMAQDFKAAFYPGADNKSITTLEFDGVALAAVQGLNQKLEAGSQRSEVRIRKLEAENAELRARNDSLNRRLERLERLLTKENGGPN